MNNESITIIEEAVCEKMTSSIRILILHISSSETFLDLLRKSQEMGK